MPRRKKMKDNSGDTGLAKQIERATKDLYYSGETDAEVVPFTGGKAESVTKEVVLAQTGNGPTSPVEEKNFEEFFNLLTAIQDWYGDEEKQTAQRFSKLRDLLQKNLRDLQVYKIGKIEMDVYVVGLSSESILMGIKTRTVET
jgi:hypothetical protein